MLVQTRDGPSIFDMGSKFGTKVNDCSVQPWQAFPVATLIGPTDELWDEALIYHYSSRSKMLSMFTDADDYRVNHLPKRNASIVDSRLIETSNGA